MDTPSRFAFDRTSVFGILILAVIGSALWSWFFEPLGSRIARGLLTLVSLNMTAFKNDTYLLISAGPHDHSGMMVILVIVFTVLVYYFPLRSFSIRSSFQVSRR